MQGAGRSPGKGYSYARQEPGFRRTIPNQGPRKLMGGAASQEEVMGELTGCSPEGTEHSPCCWMGRRRGTEKL